MKTAPLLSALALGCLSTSLNAQVVLNEVSAANWSGPTDAFGEREDWIELFNTSSAAVDLSGWFLSDSQTNNTKWPIPAGTTITANGRLMVFCSGRNTVSGGELHPNFKLTQTQGDRAVLSDASANIVDNFQFTDPTQANHSWGRTTDGAANWSLFQTPTPNAANAGAGPYYATKPNFSQPAGYYGGAVSVALSSPDAGVTIRYTLNGSEPTAASTAYAAPINIAATTVVRARAFSAAPGVPPSFIETNTYLVGVTHGVVILSCAGDDAQTLLDGNGGIEPIASMEYFGPDGVLRDEVTGTMDEHGQDSWAYNQRGFDWVTRDQLGYSNAIHYPVFSISDRDEFQRVIVKAAAGDNYEFGPGQPAHIRDAYVQALSQAGDLKLDERSYEAAVVYINGQYWGVYDLREKVDDADFTKYYYDQDEFNIQFIKTWGGTWSEYGGAQAQTDWNALVTYIMGNNMGDAAAFTYVDGELNWKSLVDYFCLNSYVVCADWLNWNTGWWRGMDPSGEHKKWGYILWDEDATFGHYTNFTGIPDQSPNADPCAVEALPDPGGQGHTNILQKLMAENETVRDYYVNRYIDLGNTLFNCDFMVPFLDGLIATITPEMAGQTARWGGSVADWQNNVQILRDFIETRCVTIEEGLIDCYDLEGPFDVVFNVDPPLSGTIDINSISPETYPWSGTYYGGINTSLAPIPADGYVFDHWEVFSTNTVLPSLLDSAVTINFHTADSVVAHFVPPVRYDVLLDVVPHGGGTITFEGNTYSNFPVMVTAPEDVDVPFNINPTLYYDFLYWTIEHAAFTPGDTTAKELTARFLTTDTIIAYLKPQEYVYYVANAFTPNGDGFNDNFQPIANVVDLESYELQIFNRWGEVIYETNNPFIGWDGAVGGTTVPDGVYVYRAFAIDAIKNDRYELFGHVTVFR